MAASPFSNTDLYQTPDPSIQTAAGIGMASYNPFNSGDGSWTPTYDPILGGFGYPAAGTSLLAAPQLQNQFFFPGAADLGVWNQDSLMLNNSWLLSPVTLDQTQLTGIPPPHGSSGLGIIDASNSIDNIGPIGQSFGHMSLNGAVHIPTPTLITGQPLVTDNMLSVVMPTPVVHPPQPEKPKTWASIASQPAKPKPPPPKQQLTPSTSDLGKPQSRGTNNSVTAVTNGGGRGYKKPGTKLSGSKLDVVSKLKLENNYNPSELTMNMNNSRFFVIKSYAEDDVHRSIKYNVWCSTEHGNKRLDSAFREQKAKGAAVYLLFSVNGSGHFCGIAQMKSEVELSTDTGIWTQDKWKGRFDILWIYVKDVPNNQLRHIRLENNENKPVTNSRDTQEVPPDKGKMVVKIIHQYQHTTSIFDDFEHYEKRQEEDDDIPVAVCTSTSGGGGGGGSKKVKRERED